MSMRSLVRRIRLSRVEIIATAFLTIAAVAYLVAANFGSVSLTNREADKTNQSIGRTNDVVAIPSNTLEAR